MELQCTRIPPSRIRLRATTRRGWRSRLGSAWLWEPSGAEVVGAVVAVGAVVTTISTSTTTIISFEIPTTTSTGRTLVTAIARTSATETGQVRCPPAAEVTGSTIRNIVAELLTPTDSWPISMAGPLAATAWPTGRTMPARTSAGSRAMATSARAIANRADWAIAREARQAIVSRVDLETVAGQARVRVMSLPAAAMQGETVAAAIVWAIVRYRIRLDRTIAVHLAEPVAA